MINTLLLILLACSCATALPQLASLGATSTDELQREIEKAFRTGAVGPLLRNVTQSLDLRDLLASERLPKEPRRSLLCSTCSLGVAQIIHEVENGAEPEAIVSQLTDLCVAIGVATLNVCEHFFVLAEPQLHWIILNRHVTGKDACGMLFVGFGCETDNPERVWEVSLPDAPKPPVQPPTIPEPGSPVMRVLHLADTHFDPYYKPGSNAECEDLYFCCREESGPPERPEAAAGQWGDYRFCDAPKWLLQAMYAHMNHTHQDIDFILWTGDLIPHNLWNTSREGNLDVTRQAVQMIKDSFPGIPVFPAVGNHEAHPVNAFPQPYIDNEFDISWLYDEIAALWATWLPEDVAASVTYSAFYSTLIKPGLRVLSINTNYCYSFNWWLLYDDVDPASELAWMAEELQRAEDAHEKVYVISHHPPGHRDCSKNWSHQYNRIVHRYESTIAGLFYGHTHKDHYMMFYDPEESERAYHVGYVAQSQTPYHKLNPGYKVYTVDGHYEGSSYRVLDHENWILDLDEANQSDEPRPFLLYRAKEAYGMSDLTPSSWSDLVYEMDQPNSTVFEDFYRHYTKAGRPLLEAGCDGECKHDLLCELLTSDNSDKSRCDTLSSSEVPQQQHM
ncbi:sphingomyelin phosphodiesterase-like isoform X2 [Penaeus japonicus]|uniref:sphingomyelin phosphodiesterase-like isoform X2 n=1 Tax=Penaeus japonicus TaxID=27405 RepID=UPI001C717759|nr:sphingomyelin phosphodiesterase-like isoform X2 [Penaeus japonicus]